jgi:hypothetical protein
VTRELGRAGARAPCRSQPRRRRGEGRRTGVWRRDPDRLHAFALPDPASLAPISFGSIGDSEASNTEYIGNAARVSGWTLEKRLVD